MLDIQLLIEHRDHERNGRGWHSWGMIRPLPRYSLTTRVNCTANVRGSALWSSAPGENECAERSRTSTCGSGGSGTFAITGSFPTLTTATSRPFTAIRTAFVSYGTSLEKRSVSAASAPCGRGRRIVASGASHRHSSPLAVHSIGYAPRIGR